MKRPAVAARRPLVGIMCCNEFSDRAVQVVATRFVRPLAHLSDVNPVLVPAVSDAADLDSLADVLDGLLLTGSRSNVAPSRYGRSSSEQPTDTQRDQVALSLSSRMIECGKSVFGICRGLQELNVLFGGTLRNLEGDHHHAVEREEESYDSIFQHWHDVQLSAEGVWNGVFERSIRVTSAHRQGVDELGYGLKVEAVADDGVIEAISATNLDAPVIAVQWHPEISAEDSLVSRTFYRLLGESLRRET